jgi:hypothetical protein
MVRRRWLFGWLVCGLAGCGGTGVAPTAAVPPAVAPPTDQKPPPSGATPAVSTTREETASKPKESPAIVVTPATVTIAPGDPGVQLVATRNETAHGRRNASAKAWKVEPEGIVTVDAGGYITPLAPGKASILATFESGNVEVPVVVEGSADRAWDFGEDIVPIFTRAGCNTGGCHGKASGQNGFQLSFLGYDPQGDYDRIARDASGRRLARMNPAESLLLAKATGRVAHGGGQRVRPGSIEYRTLLAWLEAGAPRIQGKSRGALTAIRVEPADVRLDEPGPQQMRVLAKYADGHERDVTRLASYRVNDDAALSITPEGKAVLLKRAEANLVVRYQSQVVSTRLATLINPDLEFDFAKLKRRNFIDDELFKRLESLKVPPSPPASDAVFLRRVSLDLTGLQPQPEEVRRFLADPDPDKRLQLVDRLIASHEFVLYWKIKFGDMLQISQGRFGNGASYYHTWLQEQLEKNAPWDESVHTLLTALGNPMEVGGGPANYALDGPDAKTQAEQTAQRFLALRIRCAQCHDHPFDVWTQDDYFGLAAFFAKVQRTPLGMAGRTEVKLNPKGEVEHLRTRKPAPPRLLAGAVVTVKADEDPRKQLAAWITSADNPFFARATANWVWAQFFGKGLADPPDDLSKSNPPVHPDLLDALGRHFVAHKYDLRDLIRTVVTSEAYGVSSGTVPGNEKDTRLFSHHIPRPLAAHQMADALAQATDVPNRFPNQGRAIRRAIEVCEPSTASAILDTFGRCSRISGCSSVSTPPLSLRQSLLLIGGDVIESKVTSLNGYLSSLLELKPEADEIVENLYMRVLCRPPTPEELSRWSAELKQSKSLREAAEDLFWSLLNSREFSFNH